MPVIRAALGFTSMSRCKARACLLACVAALSGCAGFVSTPPDRTTLFERVQTAERAGLTVSVAVPTAEESAQIFGADLADDGVQPVWVRIVNASPDNFLFVPAALDPDYFSPQEVAWSVRKKFAKDSRDDLQAWFERQSIRLVVRKGETIEGFVHTPLDRGFKYVNVELHRVAGRERFEFIVEEPGFTADYRGGQSHVRLQEGEGRAVTREELRALLEAMPCCVLGPDHATAGDPMNIVIIGPPNKTFFPFARRGWDTTETIDGGSTWRTIQSSVFGSNYRTSPVSPLYYEGRQQDIALQKARGTVDERNHMRLWHTPWRLDGNIVWVGQISRDIGVRMSSKTFVTHKIDPDIDETRDYLLQDMLLSRSLRAIGYVTGVGPAAQDTPRFNFTLDPYFTDGHRVVLWVAGDTTSDASPELLDWHWPVPIAASENKQAPP
jgi:hypothetical protein